MALFDGQSVSVATHYRTHTKLFIRAWVARVTTRPPRLPSRNPRLLTSKLEAKTLHQSYRDKGLLSFSCWLYVTGNALS